MNEVFLVLNITDKDALLHYHGYEYDSIEDAVESIVNDFNLELQALDAGVAITELTRNSIKWQLMKKSLK